MAVTAYFQPKFLLNHLKSGQANLATDTLKVGLIASSSPAIAARSTTQNYEFVSDFLANGGSAFTEEAGAGYSRQNLTSVTYTQSALIDTLTSANPTWTSATFSDKYAFFYDETNSSATDATRPLIAIWDLGGTQAIVGGTFILQVAGTGLVTWTAAV